MNEFENRIFKWKFIFCMECISKKQMPKIEM